MKKNLKKITGILALLALAIVLPGKIAFAKESDHNSRHEDRRSEDRRDRRDRGENRGDNRESNESNSNDDEWSESN